jgi:hypothetical protein
VEFHSLVIANSFRQRSQWQPTEKCNETGPTHNALEISELRRRDRGYGVGFGVGVGVSARVLAAADTLCLTVGLPRT